MKSKAMKRVIASVMVLLMTISLLPANMLGWEVQEVKAATAIKTYNLPALVKTIEGQKIEGTTGTLDDLSVDATQGKLSYNSDSWAQFNKGAKITFAVTGSCVVTVYSYEIGTIKVDGKTNTQKGKDEVFYCTGKDNKVEIEAIGNGYIYTINVYPGVMPTKVVDIAGGTVNGSYDFEESNSIFGEATVTESGVESADGYVRFVPGFGIDGSNFYINGGGHGLAYKYQSAFTMTIPAQSKLTFGISQDANNTEDGTATLWVDGVAKESTKQTIKKTTCRTMVELVHANDTNENQNVMVYLNVPSGTNYLEKITYKVETYTPPSGATVSGTLTGDNASGTVGGTLVFTDTSDNSNVVNTTVDSNKAYSVELPIGKTYSVALTGKAGYSIAANTTVSTVDASAGDTISGQDFEVSYTDPHKVIIVGTAVSSSCKGATTGLFGKTSYAVGEENYSEDGFVRVIQKAGSISYKDSSHGMQPNNTETEFVFKVPAGKMVSFTFDQCCYGSVLQYGVTAASTFEDLTDVSEWTSSERQSQTEESQGTIKKAGTEYKNTSSEMKYVKFAIKGSGYIHAVNYSCGEIPQETTVSGKVSDVASGTLVFTPETGDAVNAAINADGTYTVTLPIGKKYTVSLSGVANAKIDPTSNGNILDLTSAVANTPLTDKNFVAVYWDAGKTFDLTIGGAKFAFTPGASETTAFTGTVTGSDMNANIEIARHDAALIWANLGGSGSGKLTADKITAKSSNITTSIEGNVITVNYNDTTSNPKSYQLIVRDNSASGTPYADGTPLSYLFTDGSVVSALYEKGTSYKLTGGKTTTSTDKLVQLTGNTGIILNDKSHGISVGQNDTISVKVAGDATITFTTCEYSVAGNITPSGMASGATITPTSASGKASTDGTDVTFTYTGDATTLVFTFEGAGTAYIHKMSVLNKAQASEAKPQTAMPKVMDYGTKGNLSVTPVGQKLVLAQTGGALTADNGKIDSSVSYYGFDATKDINHLEADVVLNTCGSTNTAGIFFGAFDGDNIMTVGIRNSTGLRGIYSKSSSDMAGAGIVDAVIENGQKVHFDIQKTDEGLVVTATPEGGTAQTAVFKYNDSSYLLLKDDGKNQNVSYGFIVSNATATIRNMKYSNAAGTVLYDQNKCYDPFGTAPVVSSVTATPADTRDYFMVDWSSSTPAVGDGRYVLEVSLNDGAWTTVSEDIETTNYKYPVTKTGTYKFRVSGKLGVNGTKNTAKESAGVYILAALPPLNVTITSDASSITTSWNEVAGATKYEVYRYTSDESKDAATKVATVTETSYKDTSVTKEVPYYYYVIGYSADNNTNPSTPVWAVATPGHTGDYVYENEAAEIFITKKSYDTVFSGKATLEGIVDRAGTMKAMVNGAEQGTKTLAAKDTFSFELTLAEGRNDVNLLFTDANGKVTRKTYNFVYLTNYDYAVDASFTGNDGDTNVDGKPTYKTVQAAVNAVSSGNTDTKVILVMNGSYEERLVVNTPNISIIGQDRELTSIHCYPGVLGSAYEAGADMDKRCATYIQSGATGFSAENITFKNDYVYSTPDGKSNKSADAIRVEADGAMFVNVRMSSIQDTLYMHAGHQYYYKCLIEGVVDFIYSGDDARSFFNDCDIKFVYESTKTSGYVCAPRTKNTATYGLTFYNCTVTGEEGCSGTGYLLCRPWGPDAYVTWINCYMGKTINALTPYGDMSGNLATEARFFEYYSYGPGSAINEERRQISPTKAGQMLTDAYLEWTPKANSAEISANHYVGSLQSNLTDGSTTAVPNDDKYAWTDGDDTGLKAYDMEGYSAAFGVSGGGLLKEVNSNYYKVATAEEFLDALVNIKKTGKNSVIELTADINLGSKEIKNFDSYSSIITPYKAQALTHPTLIKSGVSVLNITDMHNLTIFSSNGSSIKHANITMKNSSNIIIRNIKFDELWEWNEDTSGAYDRNDWDYMTIDESTDGVWIDHCTFFKAYDGVVDIKNPAPTANVTISWCEFLPGSEDNIFFNEMMDLMSSNPSAYPYYKSLLDSGMTEDQIWWYAYGQKKTHLLGQSDTATNAAGIRVTLANNYYKNSMDRMPRLRYGASHVYNCIMDAQDLLNARNSISNESAAKHIVSNGASSTCGGSVLLENCYISGIENALNSGNGDSPAGYINAINSVYYMNGKATKLEPKVNNTIPGTTVLVTDADQFKASLPYSEYTLYDAENLKNIIVPYVGAGKMNFTVLQWEKTSYNAQEAAPEVPGTVLKAKVSEIPATVLTNEVKEATGCKTVKELIAYLRAMITDSVGAAAILSGVDPVNTSAVDVTIQISYDGGKTWENVTAQNFPKNGMDVIIPYPTGINPYNYDFVIGHLITMGCNGAKVGSMEYYNPQKVTDGLQIHINSASPFVIGWKEIPESDDEEDPIRSVATGDTTPIVPMAVMMFVSLTLCLTMAVSTRRSRKETKK